MLTEPLTLKTRTALVQGTHRSVYDAGDGTGLIVKVMRNDRPRSTKLLKRLKMTLQARREFGVYRSLFREYKHYIRAKIRAREQARSAYFPIAQIRGLINTDLGIGMLAEKMTDANGGLAPSLAALLGDGRLENCLPLLNDFVQILFDCNIVVNDLNAGNIVLAHRAGKDQFVLIDGLGDSHLIPFRTWIAWCNRRSLNKRLQRMAQRCGMEWNARERCFRINPTDPL